MEGRLLLNTYGILLSRWKVNPEPLGFSFCCSIKLREAISVGTDAERLLIMFIKLLSVRFGLSFVVCEVKEPWTGCHSS